MHHSMRYELTPTRVLKATRPPGFTPGLQQDSSEFLGYLLDLLHEHEINSGAQMDTTDGSQGGKAMQASNVLGDDIVAAGVIPYNSKDHELCSMHNTTTRSTVNSLGTLMPHNAPTPTNNHANNQSKKPPSTIDKTFAGKLSTTYKCLSCAWESRNEDSFRELQLSFPDDKDDCGVNNYSVQDLIDYYCSPEKLDGDNQYFCARCKKLCDAERRIGITQAPRNLILTLKQFKYDQKYHFRTKLMHKVFHDESVSRSRPNLSINLIDINVGFPSFRSLSRFAPAIRCRRPTLCTMICMRVLCTPATAWIRVITSPLRPISQRIGSSSTTIWLPIRGHRICTVLPRRIHRTFCSIKCADDRLKHRQLNRRIR